eukprot:m.443680 g.443680  ORF g.443680 m.443680 type:complete len:97 (+) comp18994_c0_seq1:209-499(+)
MKCSLNKLHWTSQKIRIYRLCRTLSRGVLRKQTPTDSRMQRLRDGQQIFGAHQHLAAAAATTAATTTAATTAAASAAAAATPTAAAATCAAAAGDA